MSCHGGTHFACECQRELLQDALDSLILLVNGIEKYKSTLETSDKMRLAYFIHAMPSAKSVINRSRQSKTS